MAFQEKIQQYFQRTLDILDGKITASHPGEQENPATGWWDWAKTAWDTMKDDYCNLMEKKANKTLSNDEIAALWNATGLDTTRPKARHPAGGMTSQDGFPSVNDPMCSSKSSFKILKELAYNTDESTFNNCATAIRNEYGRNFAVRLHRFAATFNPELLDVYNNDRFNTVVRWFHNNGYNVHGQTWFSQSTELQACIGSCVTYPDKYSTYEKQYISRLFGCYLWWVITQNG